MFLDSLCYIAEGALFLCKQPEMFIKFIYLFFSRNCSGIWLAPYETEMIFTDEPIF